MSDNGQSALESALIGCFGGLFATFCVYPLDLAKSKVSAHIKRKDDKGPDVSSIEVLKKIMATKGAAGLYEGMGGRALQCFVEDFVFFWCVNRIQHRQPHGYIHKIAPQHPPRFEKIITNSPSCTMNALGYPSITNALPTDQHHHTQVVLITQVLRPEQGDQTRRPVPTADNHRRTRHRRSRRVSSSILITVCKGN